MSLSNSKIGLNNGTPAAASAGAGAGAGADASIASAAANTSINGSFGPGNPQYFVSYNLITLHL